MNLLFDCIFFLRNNIFPFIQQNQFLYFQHFRFFFNLLNTHLYYRLLKKFYWLILLINL
jgi:hypothetical protein